MKPVSLQSFWLISNVVRAYDGKPGYIASEIAPLFEAYLAVINAQIEAKKTIKPPIKKKRGRPTKLSLYKKRRKTKPTKKEAAQ